MRHTSRWVVLAGCLLLPMPLAPAAAPPPVPADLYGDPLPPGAVARMGTLRFAHTGLIEGAQFAPDGKTILSFGADDTFRVWETATGRQVRSWRRQGLRVDSRSAVALSPDGKHLAMGCSTSSASGFRYYLLLCDVATGKERMRFLSPKAKGWIDSVTFSPDGKRLAAGDSEGRIRLWDLATCLEAGSMKWKDFAWVKSMAFSPDGHALVVDYNDTPALLDLATGKQLHSLRGPKILEGYFYPYKAALAFTPNGKVIATAHKDCVIRLWDANSGKKLRKLQAFEQGEVGSSKQCATIVFSRDGKTLFVNNIDGRIEVWDIETGKRRFHFRQHHFGYGPYNGPTLALSPDGRTLVSWGSSHTLRLWDVAGGKELHPAKAHRRAVSSIALSADGRTLSTAAAWGRTIGMWEAASGANRWLAETRAEVHAAVYAASGKAIASMDYPDIGVALARSGDPAEIAFREVTTGKLLQPRQFKDCDFLMALGSTRGGSIRILASSGRLYSYDAKSVETSVGVEPPGGFWFAFSSDARRLLSWNDNTNGCRTRELVNVDIFVWDAATGKKTLRFRGKQASIDSIALAPDDRTIAVAGMDGTLRLWEVATGQERWRVEGFSRVCFSPDGRLLVAGGKAGGILLYDTIRRRELHRLEGHRGEVTALAFAPDGRTFASGGNDTTALVWSLAKVIRQPPVKAGPVPAITEESWSALADDAAKAHQAASACLATPNKGGAFLRDKLRPLPPDRKQVERWLADLDNDRQAVRRRAFDRLEALGDRAEPFLSRALAAKPSPEAKRQLEKLSRPSRGDLPLYTLRLLRVVEVMENIGSAEARAVLKAMTRAGYDARVRKDAEEALARLGR